jgi:DedD protein
MDSRLKERLIGAIALVAIVVIVVPELLTGQRTQSHDPTPAGAVPQRTVSFLIGSAQPGTIARAGAAPVAAPAAAVPGAAPPAATEPAAAASAGAVSTVAGASTVPLAEPAPPSSAPVASDAPAPSAPPATGGGAAAAPSTAPRPASVAHTGEAWVIQLGSFVSRDNAERLAASLRGKSYAAFVSEFRGSGRVLYRVRVGPEHDRARADAIAARLAHEGHPGSVAPEP